MPPRQSDSHYLFENRTYLLFVLMLAGFFLSPVVYAEKLTANSGKFKTALLELFTSEGCSSCPAAEEFISGLEEKGYPPSEVIPLAYHVDYWNYLGWTDEYAKPAYTKRQKRYQILGHLPTMYTPQLVLNAKDLRPINRLKYSLASITKHKANASIELSVDRESDDTNWVIDITTIRKDQNQDVMLYMVVAESGLTSTVSAGENRGRTLHHDHVVRELLGPYQIEDISQKTTINLVPEKNWKTENIALVSFIQNSKGDVIQAVRLSLK